jgi:hypothetical protein
MPVQVAVDPDTSLSGYGALGATALTKEVRHSVVLP